MPEPKKLVVTRDGKVSCPKFRFWHYSVKRICLNCQHFKDIVGQFGNGPFILCAWEKKDA